MLARVRKMESERVFVPIIALRPSRNNPSESESTLQVMKEKNPYLMDLIRTFDLELK